MEIESVIQSCSILKFSTKYWRGVKRLPTDVLERIGNTDWVSGSKHLVSPEVVAPPANIVQAANKYLEKKSTPFPITSMKAINKNLISDVHQALFEFKDQFDQAVYGVKDSYDMAQDHARPILEASGLYNELDYPQDLSPFYKFEWQFLTLGTPQIGIISPEIYEQEVEKMRKTWEQARELTAKAMRYELAELVEHMLDRLNGGGAKKTFRDSMIYNFHEFFETAGDRNLFADEEIAKLTQRAQEILRGVDPQDLRDYDDLRDRVTSSMHHLKGMIDESIVELPRRMITLKKAA
jgi:hypothetical protein